MRKVIVMNGKYVEHNGTEYEVKERIWTAEKVTYETKAKFPTFKEVIDHLEVTYDFIEFDEGITEDESKYLYFGFNGLKEKIEKHFKNNSSRMYSLSPLELDTILNNMTKFSYAVMEAHLHMKPLFGMEVFGNYESVTIEGEGHIFYRPTTMGKNIMKIKNSTLTAYENSSLMIGHEGRSLWIEMHKNSRRTIQLNFVPKKHKEYKRRVAI